MLKITKCPSCGSNKIERIRSDWNDEYQGATYTVPELEYYECPECGERVYDCGAMRKIEMHSPAFKRTRPQKRKLA
jgi:YgiT-type zinc finger domain-containing protein